MNSQCVALLGAGLSGAVAARRLAEAGLGVRVIDKGRGIGGRMATRRVPEQDLAFDHGAQFMRAKGDAFTACLAEWRVRGVVAPWGDPGAGGQRYVGTPDMPAPVRDLLAGLPVETGRTVTRLDRDEAGWRVTDAAGAGAGPFAALLLALPAPQAARLLAESGLRLPGLERATYAPCWSLLLVPEAPVPIPGTHLESNEGPIALVARAASRPGRPESRALVVHAGPEWSRSNLEAAPETVASDLVAALGRLTGRAIRPLYARAHRWRYAQVEAALGQDCLYDPALRLGACGDWCLGPRIEAAFDSGRALAARVAADLRGASA